jgi:hypothetical protein
MMRGASTITAPMIEPTLHLIMGYPLLNLR